jgi:hypothetical protein
MRFRGQLATQIADLPDGTDVRIVLTRVDEEERDDGSAGYP